MFAYKAEMCSSTYTCVGSETTEVETNEKYKNKTKRFYTSKKKL